VQIGNKKIVATVLVDANNVCFMFLYLHPLFVRTCTVFKFSRKRPVFQLYCPEM